MHSGHTQATELTPAIRLIGLDLLLHRLHRVPESGRSIRRFLQVVEVNIRLVGLAEVDLTGPLLTTVRMQIPAFIESIVPPLFPGRKISVVPKISGQYMNGPQRWHANL